MPTDPRPESPTLNLLRAPELWSAAFSRTEGKADAQTEVEVELGFDLALLKISSTDLGVQLGVRVLGIPQLELHATFRAIFRYDGAPAERADAAFRQIGAQVAPTVIYPYIRECLSSLLLRAGISGVTLPIMNFATFFDPNEVVLPPMVPTDPTP